MSKGKREKWDVWAGGGEQKETGNGNGHASCHHSACREGEEEG